MIGCLMICFGSVVVSVIGVRALAKAITIIRYSRYNIKFISDESSVLLVLYLCK